MDSSRAIYSKQGVGVSWSVLYTMFADVVVPLLSPEQIKFLESTEHDIVSYMPFVRLYHVFLWCHSVGSW